MKKLTKLLPALALFMGVFTSCVNAQPGPPQRGEMRKEFMDMTPEQKAQKMVDKMSTELNLTEQQKKDIYNLQLQEIQRREEIRKSEIELRKATKEKMNSILTADQLKKLEEIRSERQDMRGGKYHDGPRQYPNRQPVEK